MIQGDKTGLGGGRGPGCICMGIWERKKSMGLILQTLKWMNKPNLPTGLRTGLKLPGWGHKAAAKILNYGPFIFLHKFTLYLLIPAVTFFFSTLSKVKKHWITELKLQKTSPVINDCGTNPSVHNVPCMVSFLPTFEFSHTQKNKTDQHRW